MSIIVLAQRGVLKNYAHQISNFRRIRSALALIEEMSHTSLDPNSDLDFGYEMVRVGLVGFRDLGKEFTSRQLATRVAIEKAEAASLQSPQTTAREIRRTLRDLGWLDTAGAITTAGEDLLTTAEESFQEQSLLVEALLSLAVVDDNGNAHHPVRVLLKLLAIHDSTKREGLELALEPVDDSAAEFARVAALYALSPADRLSAIGATQTQRDNAVKIFPTLALTAGLVVEEDRVYALSQDGWRVIGETPAVARTSLAKRPGRRKTVGRVVTVGSVASRQRNKAPRTLSVEEQERANERLGERTDAHQALVIRVAALIGDGNGTLFADEYSYDLFWLPDGPTEPVVLFEMKTITTSKDSYARAKDTIGQLTYYDYFWIRPTWPDRTVVRIAAFDNEVADELVEFFTHENVGVIISLSDGTATTSNPLGASFLDRLPASPTDS
jgi:hypothetical protein